jgi:hypothetical protein
LAHLREEKLPIIIKGGISQTTTLDFPILRQLNSKNRVVLPPKSRDKNHPQQELMFYTQ